MSNVYTISLMLEDELPEPEVSLSHSLELAYQQITQLRKLLREAKPYTCEDRDLHLRIDKALRGVK